LARCDPNGSAANLITPPSCRDQWGSIGDWPEMFVNAVSYQTIAISRRIATADDPATSMHRPAATPCEPRGNHARTMWLSVR
jgi:hypothetical protein